MSGLEAGSTLGGYKILARLRAGAMGVLYLARRMGPAGFARPVAIKVIHEHLAQNKRFCRMFIAEAKLSARIDDPHVVRVEEFGEADGRYFLVMEYVYGVSLAQALGVLKKRGGIPLDVSVAIAMDVASGLHAAHEATDEEGQLLGIVHRDVSPHNVLVSHKGYVKVIDFGIAKAKEGAGQTLTGSIRGKLAYMPPEQARSAKHVDRRADLYALGLVLWEMLAGRRMFDGTSDIALLNQIKSPNIVPPSSVSKRVPKELDDVVMTLLEQDPEKRPPTGATVARMLATALPAATKVLAADIAAVLNDVRVAATESKPDPEDEGSTVYGEEVKKGLAVFGRTMHESVAAADEVLDGLAPSDGAQEKTEVMMKPPVARPPAPAPVPPGAKDTIKTGPPSDAEDDDTTRRVRPEHAQRIPRHTGNQGKTIPLMSAAISPSMDRPPLSPLSSPVTPKLLPAWVTPPVMVLAPLTVILAVALVVVQCGSRSDDDRATRTTQGIASSSAAPTSSAIIPAAADPIPPLVAPPVGDPPQPSTTHPSAPVATPKSTPPKPTSPPVDNRSAYEQAQTAAMDGNPVAVRALLERRVRSGHGTSDEARLVRAACKQMADIACADDIKAKYP